MNEPAALPGSKLKAERERRGLSAQKAADEMHLDPWVIEALEGDDYARIGPTVYAKGHLKKYAALLGLPAAEVLAGFDSRAQPQVEPPSAGPSMLLRPRDDAPSAGGPALLPLAVVAVAALAAGLMWWRPWHAHAKSAAKGVAVAAAPSMEAPSMAAPKPEAGLVSSASASPAMARDTPATAAAAPTAAGSSADNAAANASAGAAETAQPPQPGAGRARLRMSFSADSWVEIHDAAGKRTFAGNGLANSVKTVAGVAPLRVYLGFGSGVQLEINDRAVAIGPQFFAGDVARFEAGADGILRRDSHPEQPHSAPPRNSRPPG